MSTYTYQNWLQNESGGSKELFVFGIDGQFMLSYNFAISQLMLSNVSKLSSGGAVVCYSGSASLPNWKTSFVSAPPGTMTILPMQTALYFNNETPLTPQPDFSLPKMLNTYLRCDRFLIMPQNDPNTYYKFNFEIEPVGENIDRTSIMLVGDKLVQSGENAL